MTRRMAPSPDNYRTIYNEIAGVTEKTGGPFPRRELKSLLLSLPRKPPAQQRLTRQLDQALKAENWEDYRKPLIDFIRECSTESELAWGDLIAKILKQWEAKQSGLTPARKRESTRTRLDGGGKKQRTPIQPPAEPDPLVGPQ